MKNIRIIARLDIKGPDLVKGIHLEGLRVLGKPKDFARFYYENGADELMYQDVVASLYGRNSLHSMITATAQEAFIPLTVGGGIRSIDDIKNVLRAGADKVCINSAALKDPEIIRRASEMFGSSTIVASIEAAHVGEGKYVACSDNGREESQRDVFEWAEQMAFLGAGELLITSIEKEGTGEGFDVELVKKISSSLTIPVIAHGGAGSSADVAEVIVKGKADAVAIAGMFHYSALKELVASVDEHEGNVEFIRQGIQVKAYKNAASVKELKKYLSAKGIRCRI